MIDTGTWRKGWAILLPSERRQAIIVLAVVIISAFSAVVMIGSVLPFLAVLSDPDRIHETRLLKWAYDRGGFESDYSFLIALGIASIMVIFLSNLVQLLRLWTVTRFAVMRGHALSQRLLATYLRQPYEFFLDHHSGEMSTKILAEAQQVVGQFFRPAAEVISSALTISAIVALLIWVEPIVALVAFALLGGIYGAVFLFTRRFVSGLGTIRIGANQDRYRIASEALTGVKDIKLLGHEGSYVDRYAVSSRRLARVTITVGLLSQVPQSVTTTIAFGGIILLCLSQLDAQGLATGEALGGILPLMGAFALAGQRMMPELGKLYRNLTQLNFGAAAVDAVHNDLARSATAAPLPGTPPPPVGLKDELRMEAVSYLYPKAEQAGVHDVTLSIRAGEKIGIVGGTGAGKTTLADILLGLLQPRAGRLIVDGQEITPDRIRAWQQSVGYVPQDIFLTDASIRENIALGVRADLIDTARAQRAAEIARIDEFIRTELSDGYDTTVGERGVRLSGGQRQRIGIARALYHDADLILFDEATSALDNMTEREVMAAIEALPGDKTVVMIAHRLSTVRSCDRIMVMRAGRLAAFDSWDNLVRTSPEFARLAQSFLEAEGSRAPTKPKEQTG